MINDDDDVDVHFFPSHLLACALPTIELLSSARVPRPTKPSRLHGTTRLSTTPYCWTTLFTWLATTSWHFMSWDLSPSPSKSLLSLDHHDRPCLATHAHLLLLFSLFSSLPFSLPTAATSQLLLLVLVLLHGNSPLHSAFNCDTGM